MRNIARIVCLVSLAFVLSAAAPAALVELGTAAGGLGAYFQGSESAANTAYARAQFEAGSDRGMYFEFDHTVLPGHGVSFNDIFSGQPSGESQFGLDGIAWVQFIDASVPTMSFADYNWDTTSVDWIPAGPIVTGTGAWAINDYFPGGVDNPGSSVRNSVLRGVDSVVETSTLTPGFDGSGYPTWTLELSGWLYTDGLVHWFYDTPDTALSDFGFTDRLYFEGTFTYNWCEDEFSLYDFYEGQATLYAEVVPEPASLTLLGLGIAGIVATRIRRRDK